MFLIIILMCAIVTGCITAANYEEGRVVTTFVYAAITAILFTYYMVHIQS